jgi:hypothetical protein
MAKLKITKEQTTPGHPEWFWYKMGREQSNVLLRYLVKGGSVPPEVDTEDLLTTCLKDRKNGGKGRLTTVDERVLLKLLGAGKLPDEQIRDVLVRGSAYVVMVLNKKRPDLLPVENVEKHIREEALQLVHSYFVRKQHDDKRLLVFIRWLEKIPGFTEVIAVYAVHAR